MILQGRMRNRATFQDPPNAQDSAGGRAGDWNPAVTVWAQVNPLRGERLFEAAKFTHEVDTEITVRYNNLINPRQRIVLNDGRIYRIMSIIRVNNIKQELKIMAKEMVDKEPAT